MTLCILIKCIRDHAKGDKSDASDQVKRRGGREHHDSDAAHSLACVFSTVTPWGHSPVLQHCWASRGLSSG